MPTINTDPEYWGGVPDAFPSEPSRLADYLEAGINAAWQGAGISTPVMHEAAWALLALRQLQEPAVEAAKLQARLDKVVERLRNHVTTKPWQRASDHENAINDAYAYTQGQPGPCADWRPEDDDR